MSKFSVAAKRFGGFMKRNAFYFLIILCIASVATVIALAVTHNGATPDTGLNSGDDTPVLNPDDNKPDDKNPDDNKPPQNKLTFISPCNGTISDEYDIFTMNPSMGQWEDHSALDFIAEDLNVYASADGKIKTIGHNDLDGNFIVIEHEDGYVTKYMSLDTVEGITEGASVKQGQLIGKMSDTQGRESLKGTHLHFEILKDNKKINPLEVLVLEEK